jgi:aryl-alcohol dehydrogenase-like predicted oxidoreductase
MEYRQLGNSGLKVSVLTMGTMTFGGIGNFAKVGNLQLDEVRKLIDIVADAGVNLIDTANVYSGGGSEELIGEAMGHKRKPGMLIATKARYPMGEGPNDRGLSRWHLIRECEASLKRLRADVIDLYQVHQWDGLTPLEETMVIRKWRQKQLKRNDSESVSRRRFASRALLLANTDPSHLTASDSQKTP